MPNRSAKTLYQLQRKAQCMFSEGMTNGAIARQLNTSVRTIQRWRNSPEDTLQGVEGALAVLDEARLQNNDDLVYFETSREPQEPTVELKNDALGEVCSEDSRKISELFKGALDGLQNLLINDELSPRDRISCFKLVLELKRDSATFCSNKKQVQDSELSDFQLVRQTLRETVLSPNANPRNAQNAIALLKLLQAQDCLPKSIVSNQRGQALDEARREVEAMTSEQLFDEYQRIIREV